MEIYYAQITFKESLLTLKNGDKTAKELGITRRSFSNADNLHHEVIANEVRDARILFVVRMGKNKVPHKLGIGLELARGPQLDQLEVVGQGAHGTCPDLLITEVVVHL